MANTRTVICKNAKGKSVTLGYKNTPYWLESIDGLGTPNFSIYTTKGSTQDGERYVSSNADMRDIDISLIVTENVVENVNALYDIFIPKQKGIFYYYRDDIECQIEYYVEELEPINFNSYKKVNISLSCPYPFFQDINDTKVDIAFWEGLIEFPLELSAEPFEMTTKVQNLIANVYNDSNIDLGMTITFKARTPVTNPSLFNVNTRNFFKVNIEMQTGDEVIVYTNYRNKKIELKRNGVTTDITYLMDWNSTWLQAYDGDNLFRYDAYTGLDGLDVAIYYRQLRLGVV